MAGPACMSDDGNQAVFVGTFMQNGDAVALCPVCLPQWACAVVAQSTDTDLQQLLDWVGTHMGQAPEDVAAAAAETAAPPQQQPAPPAAEQQQDAPLAAAGDWGEQEYPEGASDGGEDATTSEAATSAEVSPEDESPPAAEVQSGAPAQ